jgi:hypothetical protein
MNDYVDLRGQVIDLSGFSPEEAELWRQLQADAPQMDSAKFRNHWLTAVANLLAERGLSKREIMQSRLYRIAQDLGSRIQVERGEARAPDYRDDLATLIFENFKTRRAFCEATGLTEDMLSHVLAGRKHLAIDTLTEALHRVGYRIAIAPVSKSRTPIAQ